jgi:hypothetical protein
MRKTPASAIQNRFRRRLDRKARRMMSSEGTPSRLATTFATPRKRISEAPCGLAVDAPGRLRLALFWDTPIQASATRLLAVLDDLSFLAFALPHRRKRLINVHTICNSVGKVAGALLRQFQFVLAG